ncbi:hypothetical protein [Streptomyces sp. NPDC048172]
MAASTTRPVSAPRVRRRRAAALTRDEERRQAAEALQRAFDRRG